MTTEELVSTITEQVKDTANVRVVFGNPFTASGVTVIPVGTVKIAGGGGGGGGGRADASPLEGEEETGGGLGLGLNITSRPLGYIEITDGSAKLIPIVDVTKIAVTSLITGGLLLFTIGKLIAKRAS